MMNNIKYCLVIFISIIFYNSAKAQNYQQALILEAVDSVEAVFSRLQYAKNDNEKYKLNGYIKSYVDFLLNEDEKFQFRFDTLGNLSVVESANGKLRVLTWNLFLDDGSYKYFGFLHYRDGKKTEIFQLEDFSNDTSSLRKFKSHKEWYGALYYDIIEKKWNKKTYYILLGWDGADMLINRKIIESLEFSRKNLPEFGVKIFVEGRTKKERLIYEYAESASMMLDYNPKHDIIVLNHLIPLDPRFQDVSHYYGPDFSYDAFEFRMGKWYLVENIDPDKALNFKKNKHINNLKQRGASKDF